MGERVTTQEENWQTETERCHPTTATAVIKTFKAGSPGLVTVHLRCHRVMQASDPETTTSVTTLCPCFPESAAVLSPHHIGFWMSLQVEWYNKGDNTLSLFLDSAAVLSPCHMAF